MRARIALDDLRAADGRVMSSGSTFSTILLSWTIGREAPSGSGRLLDVGCGSSPYRGLVATAGYVGVDRATGPSRPAEAFVVGDATALPFADRSFDAVLCTEVIEHVPDERLLAAELARVAAPGADLLLTSPFVHGLHEMPDDFRRLTSIGLTSTLEQAGWAVERVVSVGGPLVVTLDSFVRWVDGAIRRTIRRLPGARSPGAGTEAVSRTLQQGLAAVVLATPRLHLGAIDPAEATPRLTLGYVVSATRR